VGEPELPGRLDEKVQPDFSSLDKVTNMKEKVVKTRDEVFAESTFEWVKSERSGDLSKFSSFETENGVEYVKFVDNTRVKTDLIGDVVLMHQHSSEILGGELIVEPSPMRSTLVEHLRAEKTIPPAPTAAPKKTAVESSDPVISDPVISILEKTKKRNEKLTLTLTVKIPSPDLYNVIKENFDNVDEILLNSVLEQIQEDTLKDALRRELQSIYTKKKKA